MSTAAVPKKKGFKIPHLFFLILFILIFMSLMTYIIPPGAFEDGVFTYLPERTPVNPWKAMMLILEGMKNSGQIVGLLLAAGGYTSVVLSTKSIDKMIDFAIYKLQDKGMSVLVPGVFLLYCFIGCFAGGDQIIAMVPIGLMFAKKMRLDPVCGLALVLFAYHIGGLSSPNYAMQPHLLMDVPVYSGFGPRVICFIVISLLSLPPVLSYCRKVAADPTKSVLPVEDWVPDLDTQTDAVEEKTVSTQDILTVVIFLLQPICALILVTGMKMGNGALVALQIILAIVIGMIHKYDMDKTGKTFAQGTAMMAFVGYIIGCASAMSLVMSQGQIIATIVNFFCIPLRNLGSGLASVGISMVCTIVNMIVPSASAMAAILCPIIKPMCENLGISAQMGVQALGYGDKLTNIISPVLGTTVAALGLANIPYDKWFKWVAPKIAYIAVICWASLYVLSMLGFA